MYIVDDMCLLFLSAVWTNIHISPPEHSGHSAEPNMCPVAALATLHPLNKHKGSVVLQLFWGHAGTNTAMQSSVSTSESESGRTTGRGGVCSRDGPAVGTLVFLTDACWCSTILACTSGSVMAFPLTQRLSSDAFSATLFGCWLFCKYD